jgi:hypothetical protein
LYTLRVIQHVRCKRFPSSRWLCCAPSHIGWAVLCCLPFCPPLPQLPRRCTREQFTHSADLSSPFLGSQSRNTGWKHCLLACCSRMIVQCFTGLTALGEGLIVGSDCVLVPVMPCRVLPSWFWHRQFVQKVHVMVIYASLRCSVHHR